MARFGLCSGSYTSSNIAANDQSTVNWYPEADESGQGKSAVSLLPTPGLKTFSSVPGQVLATYNANGRMFAASIDGNLYEVMADGSTVNRGPMPAGGSRVQIAGSAIQLLICNGLRAFCYDLATNTLTDITLLLAKPKPIMTQYLDGAFAVLFGDSQFFQISGLEDGLSWSGVDTYQVEVYTDNVLSMLVDHREMWLFGLKGSQVYFNSGAASNPFSPIVGGFIEQGIVAPFSPVKLDNSVMWIGGDERGAGIAWRAQGYNPARISNFAIEAEWQRYPTISDAIGYSYQQDGHSFWHIWFPTPKKSWRYDVSTGAWHEVAYWRTDLGAYEASHSRNHVFCFGKHLVGDWSSGKIYEMSSEFHDDDGNMIRRLRRSPYIASEGVDLFFHRLELDLEAGVGLVSGQGSDPQVAVRWSDDRGHTWSNSHIMPAGRIGEYGRRCILRRLGHCQGTLGRIFEIIVTDPISWKITDGYILADPGFQPTPRYSRELAKMA